MPPGFGHQPPEAVVGLERVAAGGDEIEDFLECLLLQPGIGRGGADLGEQFLLLERRGDRHRQDVLGEHVERAGAEDLRVELAVVDGVERRAGLEILEAVAGDDDALARLVEPVVGAADPLQQPRAALRARPSARRGRRRPSRCRGRGWRSRPARAACPAAIAAFDLAPRLDREAAVVDADRQRLVVDRPQVLEDQLGEAARVAEDERRLVLLDQLHHFARRVAPGVAAPRNAVLRDQDRQVRLGARIADDQVDQLHVGIGREPASGRRRDR